MTVVEIGRNYEAYDRVRNKHFVAKPEGVLRVVTKARWDGEEVELGRLLIDFSNGVCGNNIATRRFFMLSMIDVLQLSRFTSALHIDFIDEDSEMSQGIMRGRFLLPNPPVVWR